MREIIFRGKRIDNGEWVEGNLFVSDTDGSTYILAGSRRVTIEWEVDPGTVGQYTGLKDKDGKRIFRDDIVRYNTFDDFSCVSVVKFGEYDQDGSSGEYNPSVCVGWYVEVCGFTCPDWADNDPIFFKDYQKQQNLLEVNEMCEVVGNIHDLIQIGGNLYFYK